MRIEKIEKDKELEGEFFPLVMMRFMEDGKGFMVKPNKAIRPEVVAEGIVGLLLGDKELREIFLSLSENVQGELEERIKSIGEA